MNPHEGWGPGPPGPLGPWAPPGPPVHVVEPRDIAAYPPAPECPIHSPHRYRYTNGGPGFFPAGHRYAVRHPPPPMPGPPVHVPYPPPPVHLNYHRHQDYHHQDYNQQEYNQHQDYNHHQEFNLHQDYNQEYNHHLPYNHQVLLVFIQVRSRYTGRKKKKKEKKK